jgi:hypothetical protein
MPSQIDGFKTENLTQSPKTPRWVSNYKRFRLSFFTRCARHAFRYGPPRHRHSKRTFQVRASIGPTTLSRVIIHDLPYQPGNDWQKRIDQTLVITPGQLLDASFPNHVILELPDGHGGWVTDIRSGTRDYATRAH